LYIIFTNDISPINKKTKIFYFREPKQYSCVSDPIGIKVEIQSYTFSQSLDKFIDITVVEND